jgi:hypothetical protein
MQSQQQQTTQTHNPSQTTPKRIRRSSLRLRIVCFSITILLLLVTSMLLIKTGATSPYTLLSSLCTGITMIFIFLQLTPLFSLIKSDPPTVIQNQNNYYNSPTNPTNTNIPHTPPTSAQPVFRYNMSLKYPSEFYGRAWARTTLISRTASESCTSLVGERRIGKTWLMEYLQLIAPTHPDLGPRFRIGYLSATNPECETLAGFAMKALQTLKVPASHLN